MNVAKITTCKEQRSKQDRDRNRNCQTLRDIISFFLKSLAGNDRGGNQRSINVVLHRYRCRATRGKMAYIKWRRNRPYVYKSVRETEFTTKERNGRYEATEVEKVVSHYLGSYQSYRTERPCGSYVDIMSSEKLLAMMAGHQDKLTILMSIDAAVYLEFERGQK